MWISRDHDEEGEGGMFVGSFNSTMDASCAGNMQEVSRVQSTLLLTVVLVKSFNKNRQNFSDDRVIYKVDHRSYDTYGRTKFVCSIILI